MSKNLDEWRQEYEAERPHYVAFTEALKALLGSLLPEASIPYAQIEARTKDVPNLVGKIKRKNEKYGDLAEVTDLAGVRIVLFYLDDVGEVGRLIGEQFDVDPINSVDKSASLDPDRFGYISVHHVIKLSPERAGLLEWRRFAGLNAEIQVRTVLQHAWGAISRKLAYASVSDAPRNLQRHLNRLSALLELADEEFVGIRSARQAIEKQYDREVERGNLDLDIDESSLDVYLRESGAKDRISRMAREAGSPTLTDKLAGFADLDFDLDPEEEEENEFRALLGVLRAVGFKRISDMDQVLESNWDQVPGFMQEVNSQYTLDHDGKPLSDEPYNWLTLIILWATKSPGEIYREFNYVDELIDIATGAQPVD